MAAISREFGIPENVVRAVRRHVFLEVHEIAVGPGRTIRSRFVPQADIAELWTRAAGQGTPLNAVEILDFRRLIAHEYVEHSLMRHGGLPFRSSDPRAWVFVDGGWRNVPTPEAFGAHDMAPLGDWQRPPFAHYFGLGLGNPSGVPWTLIRVDKGNQPGKDYHDIK